MQEVFEHYIAKNYNIHDQVIADLFEHSIQMMEKMHQLGLLLKLEERQLLLAQMIGLLHDFGKFEQWRRYQVDYDNIVDHGTLGADLLFKENVIEEFNQNIEEYQTIYEAIKRHNQFEIDDKASADDQIFIDMIRDLEKIHQFEKLIKEDLSLVACEITDSMKESYCMHKPIKATELKTKADFILMVLGMVDSLVYDESIALFSDDHYLDLLSEDMSEAWDVYLDQAKEVVQKRLHVVKKGISEV